jgi:hypothetical protein
LGARFVFLLFVLRVIVMSRLILTFGDSVAAGLREATHADCVVPFTLRFVWGQLRSTEELNSLLATRSTNREVDADYWPDTLGTRFDEVRKKGLGLADFCERFDAVELWADPEPNTQLQLVWLLHCLRQHSNVLSRLALVQKDIRLVSLLTERATERQRPAVPIHNDHLEIASAAWAAWRAPTPVAWLNLLAQDLSALSQLRNTIVALLEELPMRDTGLGATEMRMLQLLVAGNVHPYDLFPGREKPNERRSYGYWEVGELLDGLARCPAPAVSGLAEGPFDDALHDNKDRHDRYRQSRLSLTKLGKAVLAQSDDFNRHNPIHRWWGGTELTNDRLWRWDPENRRLVAP